MTTITHRDEIKDMRVRNGYVPDKAPVAYRGAGNPSDANISAMHAQAKKDMAAQKGRAGWIRIAPGESQVQEACLEALGGMMTARNIADATGLRVAVVTVAMHVLHQRGAVVKIKRGKNNIWKRATR